MVKYFGLKKSGTGRIGACSAGHKPHCPKKGHSGRHKVISKRMAMDLCMTVHHQATPKGFKGWRVGHSQGRQCP